MIAFPVYRSYLPEGLDHWATAVDAAKRARPDLAGAHRHHRPGRPRRSRVGELATRIQQTSGMVVAKGRRGHRVLPLDPVRRAQRGRRRARPVRRHVRRVPRPRRRTRGRLVPRRMTTLSTHDTKRSEDVRARLAVLSELPDEWAADRHPLVGHARHRRARAEPPRLAVARRRVADLRRAPARLPRQGGQGSQDPHVLGRPRRGVRGRRRRVAREGASPSSATRSRRSSSGSRPPAGRTRSARSSSSSPVPACPTSTRAPSCSTCPLWTRTTAGRSTSRTAQRLLARLEDGWLPDVDDTGAAKLHVVRQVLRLRRDRPELFTGYRPLPAQGPAADHVARVQPAARAGGRRDPAAGRLARRRLGATPCCPLPAGPGTWRDLLTGTPSTPARSHARRARRPAVPLPRRPAAARSSMSDELLRVGAGTGARAPRASARRCTT